MKSPTATLYLSRAEVREVDRRAVEEYGVPSIILMENAGRGAAELLMLLNPERSPVTILCGPGNNGGDGFVIARYLDIHRYPVHVWVVLRSGHADGAAGNAIEEKLSADARVNFSIARRAGIAMNVMDGALNDSPSDTLGGELRSGRGWIVDALFGTGLRAALGTPFDSVIAAANQSGRPILAIDVPSGLDCDSGEPLGATVRAKHTATFVAQKPGFMKAGAVEYTGEVHVIDIGAPRQLVEQFT